MYVEFLQCNGRNMQYGAFPSWTSLNMLTSSPGGCLKAKELAIAMKTLGAFCLGIN